MGLLKLRSGARAQRPVAMAGIQDWAFERRTLCCAEPHTIFEKVAQSVFCGARHNYAAPAPLWYFHNVGKLSPKGAVTVPVVGADLRWRL